jgi:hypothetical protein
MPAIINSDDGVVSGSAGLKTSGANDGITAFQQNGTEQARITAAGLFQFNSGYGSVATAYGCRAWVSFNGTGTVAIQASGNVTSITDGGTGTYTVNFTTAMPDANYAAVLGNGGGYNDIGGGTKTASAVQLFTYNFGNPPGLADRTPVSVAVFR